jgi:hypothetical protein
MAKWKLKGPLEKDIQLWILKSLGIEQRSPKWDRKLRCWIDAPSGVFVDKRGSMFWRANSGGVPDRSGRAVIGNPRGTADILGIVCGVLVGLEVKRPGEKLNRTQVWWHDIVDKAGGVVAVVECPSDAKIVVEGVRDAQAQDNTDRYSDT